MFPRTSIVVDMFPHTGFLNKLTCELTEYEEQYVRTLLEKITVYDDHFIVEFKSGMSIDVNR